MKRIFLSILVFFVVFYCIEAYAHPPADIKLEYNSQSRILSVVITHPVNNTESHFIKKIDVSVNGKEVITHILKRQDTNATQLAVYMIPDADAGDAISIEAYCSISGKLKKEVKVEK